MSNSLHQQEWIKNNVIQFPVSPKIPDTASIVDDILQKREIPIWSVEFFLDKWLDLFRGKHHKADFKMLTDSPYELIKISKNDFSIDWHENIWKLLICPTTKREVIEARKFVLEKVNSLPGKFHTELYKTFASAKHIYSFDDVFDNFDDLERLINELEENKNRWDIYSDNDTFFCSLMSTFWSWGVEMEEARTIIPKHIQLLRNIPGDFFSKSADTLHEAFMKAKNFSMNDLKRIVEEQDYEWFSDIKKNLKEFCSFFSDWDWILIASRWIKNWYIKSSKIIDDPENEKITELRDPRPLLSENIDKFYWNIPNDPPIGKSLEVYTGGNWSGKSTWLKSRLALQLFHQTYGYVPALNAELPLRSQIIFLNRWWSWYWEDLSAFWNDVRKLMEFIGGVQKNSLIFLDEFWSTIPENEAFVLIKAIEEYLLEHGAKVLSATHNEKYIRELYKERNPQKWIYHFNCRVDKSGTMDFYYKLKEWKDSAHTLNVFKAAGVPQHMLYKASWNILWKFMNNDKLDIPYGFVLSYSDEEREMMKKEIWWFAGFSRYNDMVKVREKKKWSKRFQIMRKFKPLEWEERPNVWYYDQDLFFSAHHPDCLDAVGKMPSFDFMTYSKDEKLRLPKYLTPKKSKNENVYDSTLQWMVTWWLTNDTKELLERQKFFEEAGEVPFKEVAAYYNDVNIFLWIASWFIANSYHSKWMDVKLEDLWRFNKVMWEHLIENLPELMNFKWVWAVTDWFLGLVEMEIILWNIPWDYCDLHKEKFDLLRKTVKLAERHNRAYKRERIWMWKEKFSKSKDTSVKIQERIQDIFSEMFQKEWLKLDDMMKGIWADIDSTSKWFDILTMEKTLRSKVATHIDDKWIFRVKDDWGESLSGWFTWMMQIIRSIKWTGNLARPLIERLKTLNSTHANSIANYLDDFMTLPKVEEFVEMIRLKRDDIKKYERLRYDFNIERKHQWTVLYELNWIFYAANQIKKLKWAKVNYNTTWEIDIRSMYNPSMKKVSEQVKNDFHLNPSESFEILEWATMWGKTMHIQSMQWIMRLAHSIWYVPAEYASMPVFDWMLYIDRILEDEKKNLSAGQHDAKIWSEIIAKITAKVKEGTKGWRYWFAIDEMISSVPARFQKWLVVAIVDELKRLWQRWQISIHNPELVTALLDLDTISYKVHHPEVKFDSDWKMEHTYKIIPWRSIDKNGNYSAFSLETAENLWLPKDIVERMMKIRNR
ncbi:MAG: DNA mismatch repair protein MutS [uncultured bacterium (gcode 4)]|uniref:DNA mismatch repair protein MutS n=1 Tax=uncultured bacterium (gcode 4) TaxID=1234023 RepID=K2FZJ4_9BACT|nr:MAG: DNA mismatch repair protein MutS [uncultured bacterium (gcode 4)]